MTGYDETVLEGKFMDFDSEEAYALAADEATSPTARNFVVDFGARRARIAFNLEIEELKALLNVKPAGDYGVRWMCV
jgi:hypothetical protein